MLTRESAVEIHVSFLTNWQKSNDRLLLVITPRKFTWTFYFSLGHFRWLKLSRGKMELNWNEFQRVLARDNFQTDLCCLPFVRDAKTNLAWTLFCPYINTLFPRSSHPLSLSLRASLRPKSFFRLSVFTHIGIKTNYNNKNFVLRGTRKQATAHFHISLDSLL